MTSAQCHGVADSGRNDGMNCRRGALTARANALVSVDARGEGTPPTARATSDVVFTLRLLTLCIVLTSGLARATEGALAAAAPARGFVGSPQSIADGAPIQYRVGFLGIPSSTTQFKMLREVPWSRENLQRLRDLGFNTLQLNVAWGRRPGDEPLNIEDVVRLEAPLADEYPQPVELRSKPGEDAYQQRRGELRTRAELGQAMGFRTIFHFGAPYNAHAKFAGTEPNCILDERTTKRYELLIERFARDFPKVDDILVYTYDQDAWLCSEFANCPRCAAVPLHERLPAFLDRLTSAWRKVRPQGRLWWEPWELSAGQVYQCQERIKPEGFGLALHANIAEVMSTFSVDRWLKNSTALAAERGVPVIVEYFLGATSEEVEPLMLASPLVTLRGLKAIAELPGVVGIKEYYGLAPEREDPNLRMTGLFFSHPANTEAEALRLLAEPYGAAAKDVQTFWRLCGSAMEFFPWEATWYIRRFGDKPTLHRLDQEAKLRPFPPSTPSWSSSRQSMFIRIAPVDRDHPWLTEDMQLRLEIAAGRWKAAEQVGRKIASHVPAGLDESFAQVLRDTGRIRRRAASMAYHMRETNLVRLMRTNASRPEAFARARGELLHVLQADRENHLEELAQAPATASADKMPIRWPEIDAAIAMLQGDADRFLATYLK